MSSQHRRKNSRDPCDEPAGAVEKVDGVHHPHEPENGQREDDPPRETIGAKEKTTTERIVHVFDKDQTGKSNECGAKLDQVLGTRPEIELVVEQAKDDAID
ncbi:MAG: hypothetical protein IPK16_05520 [Anaerolineales bacterium]|nr:hypothetical protein [Anaerolineales bacterium]